MQGKSQGKLTLPGDIRRIEHCDPARLPDEVLRSEEPLVLAGLVANWPIVKAATASTREACRYLNDFCSDVPVTVSAGPAQIDGRIFYNEDMTGFNFEAGRTRLADLMTLLQQLDGDSRPPVHYMGSTSVDYCLPGFRQQNDLGLDALKPLVSIWTGNQTRIAAHYDVPDNIACVAVGRRRFTLFPPDQLNNLYVGPLDFAPAGQCISLVDLSDPDFDRFPRFRQALEHASRAELEPGDAIFIPSMWWHNVEGLDAINVLINYWWRQAPACMGNPLDVLNHALLSMRDLPPAQRKAWQRQFEHYIFAPTHETVAHIPEHRWGALGPGTDESARRLRASLLRQLNR